MISLSEISSIAENPKLFSADIFQKLILNPCIKTSSLVLDIDAKQLSTSIFFSTWTHVFLKKYAEIIWSSTMIT